MSGVAALGSHVQDNGENAEVTQVCHYMGVFENGLCFQIVILIGKTYDAHIPSGNLT